MKFKKDRPFANPEIVEQELLELANAMEADHAGRSSSTGNSWLLAVAPRNMARRSAGEHSWTTMHPSGAYMMFTQAGADLFA